MDIKEFAIFLTGREYGKEITAEEEKMAKDLGFVVVFGYSDDNAEFRGAIYDEVGCYGGKTIFLDNNGILEECDCECKYYRLARENAKKIDAIFGDGQGCFWKYETEIPHAEFDIFEGNEKYCIGIVFDIKELKN